MENFSLDLVLDILSRLPVKSIVRFRCVCKSWRSLISKPQFVKMHLDHAITDITVGFQRLAIPGIYSTLKTIDYEAFRQLGKKKLREARRNSGGNACTVLDFPWGSGGHRVTFVGSCHGMVCVVVDHEKIVLFNPCTRKYRELPKPTSINFKYSIHGGLGYDSYADDYKFVIAVHENGDDNYSDGEFKAEVFSLRSNSWRNIQDIHPDICRIYGFEAGVFINGALHWIVICKTRGQKIISFDLATEKFHELLSLPPPHQGNNEIISYDYSNIILLGGCLSVSDDSSWKVKVWVMKEYGVEASWTKLFTLNIRFYEPMHHYLFPVCISMNGQLIVDMDDEIIIYNPKNQNYRKLHSDTGWLKCVVQYMESLVSPNGLVEFD